MAYDDGKSRGFGFVTFEDRESTLLALADVHILYGRQIDVKATNGLHRPFFPKVFNNIFELYKSTTPIKNFAFQMLRVKFTKSI